MKKIDAFVLRSYLGPLVMTFFIALFILLMQFVWKYIDDLVGKGLEWYIIAKLLFFASSTFVPLALPLAILLSSLMMFGNMGEHYELVAIKSAGVSLRRVMAPLVIVSVMISGLAFYFSNVILPVANLKFLSLLYDVREKKLAFNIKEGVFYNGIEGYVIRVGKKEQDGNTIRDVMVYDHSARMGNNSLTLAEWGKMELTSDKRFLIFRLYNGTNYEERTDLRNATISHPFQRTKFREQFQMFDLSAFQLTRTDEKLFKNNYEMLNIGQLRHSIDSLKTDYSSEDDRTYGNFVRNFYPNINADTLPHKKEYTLPALPVKVTAGSSLLASLKPAERLNILKDARNSAKSAEDNLKAVKDILDTKQRLLNKHEIVMHKKFTFSIACFLLFFIGAPLGAIIRKGGLGLPAVVSTLFFILFWVLSFTGEKYTVAGILPAWQGMWIAPAVLFPIGVFLTYKATIDASLMDVDSWSRGLRQLIHRIRQKFGGSSYEGSDPVQ
jgi:lipopolysaccharide export system permease protein